MTRSSETRPPQSWKVSAGAGAIVVVLLATGSVPTASAQAGLADWLSPAAAHVADIHKAENAAYAVMHAGGPIDPAALAADCVQLRDANEALRGGMPSPDPKLTVEVQQAIDNFDSASQSCGQSIGTGNTALLGDFVSSLLMAEQHLSSADTVLVALARVR